MCRPVPSSLREHAEIDRLVEVDVVERAPQQLQGVAGQRIRVLLGDAQLLGDAVMTLAEAECDDRGGPLGWRQRGERVVQPADKLLIADALDRAHVVRDGPGRDRAQPRWTVGGHSSRLAPVTKERTPPGPRAPGASTPRRPLPG